MRRSSVMNSGRSVWGRILGLSLVFVVACTALVATEGATSASALSGSDFNPGTIISDDLFYDGNAMTAGDIQSFLDGKIGTCQTDRCLNVAVVPVTSRSADYSSVTGQLICSAMSGGNLRVSELIYRAQVACGISAKVILVTLQKEQGLVTSRAPSDWALRAAMGMGCPDTAPCSDAFTGLASQIWSGTRQLKIYKAARFARQPGVQYVQYHPNAGCGGTNVDVTNYATAALYSYTPYQPNAAALANLGGTGDSCSSYGNRNFWRFYNNWFGSTIEIPCTVNPTRDITRLWTEQSGVLGSPVAPGTVPGPAGTTIGHFANGNVYCTPRIGAVPVLDLIRDKFDALGGVSGSLGSPLKPKAAFSAAGLTGATQEFQRGTMVSNSTTGTFAVLHGPIRSEWSVRGGSGGSLGWPTGDQESVTGGVRQQFQHGLLMVPVGQPAIVLTGAIGSYWTTGSNATVLGSPTGASGAYSAGGVAGTLQYFQRGLVLSSSTTGTFAVLNNSIRDVWGSMGGSGGSLGWPTGDQVSTSDGYRQQFQRGTVYASTSGAGGVMSGAIASYWAAESNASRLGSPTSSPSPWSAGGVSGTLQYFERGMVLSSTTTGTFAVLDGPMRDAWGAKGGSGGSVGWPTGDQETVNGELRQQFQRDLLKIETGVSGDIATYWTTGSNAARLGPAAGDPAAWSAGGVSGTLQYFQRGMVLSSATTGTFAVLSGPFRDAWGSLGGSGGSLGWPIGDQESVAGGARQLFQHGFITVPTRGLGVALSGDIATYWATGLNGSRLGTPTSSPSPWSAGGVSGTLQYFQRGMVLSSSTTGTFAVLNGAFRDAWGSAGGSGGSLGWPTADQKTVPGGVSQLFQHGVLTVPTGGNPVVLSGAIAAYWSTGSNATFLGSPTASSSNWSAGGLTGTLQNFERGMVLSSTTTGTFAVLNGDIRNTWGALGGTGGSLGWPTADQTAGPLGTRQQFQKGTLTISPDGSPLVLSGEYYRYWSSGSNATILGSPSASPVPWTAGGVTGSYQVFERAMVLSSATTGTFAVLDGPIRDTWGAIGGSGGSLGWPTADQTSVPEGFRQQFQRGAIMVPSTGAPYVISG